MFMFVNWWTIANKMNSERGREGRGADDGDGDRCERTGHEVKGANEWVKVSDRPGYTWSVCFSRYYKGKTGFALIGVIN